MHDGWNVWQCTDRISSFYFVVILWALWTKQALNHGLFVNFKGKKSRHSDFNHISHWTRYNSNHSFQMKMLANQFSSFQFIELTGHALTKTERKKQPKQLQHDLLLFHGHFQHYFLERVTLVTLCVPIYCRHQFVKLLVKQQKINMTPFLFYKHLNS